MLQTIIFILSVQSADQKLQLPKALSDEDFRIIGSFMTVGNNSTERGSRTGKTNYLIRKRREIASDYWVEFANDVEAIVQPDGFIRMVRDTSVPWNARPYPLHDTPVSEAQARASFYQGLNSYRPQFDWKVERMSDKGDASSGNGVWTATGFGFVGYPTIEGVRIGPTAAVDGKINADVPRFEFARLLKLPTGFVPKPKIKITADKADNIAVSFSLRGNIMLQPEVREHSELIISCDSLGILRSVPGVGATRNWMRRDHPKVKALKGANMGIYGYLVKVRSALSLSECMRSNSAWEITYLIDPEDGSMIAGYDSKGK